MEGAGASSSGKRRAPAMNRKSAKEAATWIARLHGPHRSPQMEEAVRQWLARSADNRLAFERCTDVWQEVAGVTVADAFQAGARVALDRAMAREHWWARWRWPVLLLLAVSLLAAAAGLYRWWEIDDYSTKIGELQVVMLADGTRVSLNTDTRLRVDLDAQCRSVRLERGEALFEVAKDPHRPFVVHAAGSEVVALGTEFSVRLPGLGEHRNDALAVTLIEGQVSVRPSPARADRGAAPAKPVLMQPGERMRLERASGGANGPVAQQVDRPRIEELVAWKRSEVVFDDVSLSEAVAEMNRYNRVPIVVSGLVAASGLRVSGQYRTGDSSSFAQAVAALHGLSVRDRDGRLELGEFH